MSCSIQLFQNPSSVDQSIEVLQVDLDAWLAQGTGPQPYSAQAPRDALDHIRRCLSHTNYWAVQGFVRPCCLALYAVPDALDPAVADQRFDSAMGQIMFLMACML